MKELRTTPPSKGRQWFCFFLVLAIAIKFSLYLYIVNFVPSAFIDPDTPVYLQGAHSIQDFLLHPEHGLTHNSEALPGYPLVLAGFLYGAGLYIYQMILIQILLNFCTAFVVMRIARAINPDWELLSGIIVLLDLPLTIYSQMLMTEAVFVLALSCAILCFRRYIVNPSYQRLILASLVLTVCVYIRPVVYYLPLFIAAFIIFSGWSKNRTRSMLHACVVILIAFGLCMPWQFRNFKRFGDARMSSIGDQTLKQHSFLKDSAVKKSNIAPNLPGYIYYPAAFSRNVLELLTSPGSLRPCHSWGWTLFSKVFGYGLIAFWIPGFMVGLMGGPKDARYALLIIIFLYFLCVTIWATGWTVTSRFRIAMLPSIAIIATAGWCRITSWYQKILPSAVFFLFKEE